MSQKYAEVAPVGAPYCCTCKPLKPESPEKCPVEEPEVIDEDKLLSILPFKQIGEDLKKDLSLRSNEQLSRKWDYFLTHRKHNPVEKIRLYDSFIIECEKKKNTMPKPMQLNGGFFDCRNRLAPIPVSEEMKTDARYTQWLLEQAKKKKCAKPKKPETKT